MQQSATAFLLCLFLFLVGACSLFQGLEGEVDVIVEEDHLVLQNETNRRIYYRAADHDVMTRVYSVPSGYEGWPSIAAGKSAIVSFDEVRFYSEETTRLSIIWRTRRGDDGMLLVSLNNE